MSHLTRAEYQAIKNMELQSYIYIAPLQQLVRGTQSQPRTRVVNKASTTNKQQEENSD